MKKTVIYFSLIFILASSQVKSENTANVPGPLNINILKKYDLEEVGQGGVCVHGDNMYLTLHDLRECDKNFDKSGRIRNGNTYGICMSEKDGSVKWRVPLSGSKLNSFILETFLDCTTVIPVADEDFVYFMNTAGEICCCTHSGKVVWRKKFEPLLKSETSSPNARSLDMLLWKNTLIVNLPTEGIAPHYSPRGKKIKLYKLHALDRKTGKTVWVSDEYLGHECNFNFETYKDRKLITTANKKYGHWDLKAGGAKIGALFIDPDTGSTVDIAELGDDALFPRGPFLTDGKNLVFQQKTGKEINIGLYDLNKKEIISEYPSKPYTWRSQLVLGNKHYGMSYKANDLICTDMSNGNKTSVKVPYQVINGKEIWAKKDCIYTEGVMNAKGELRYKCKSARGYKTFGWGYTLVSRPQINNGKIYFLSGCGMIYEVDPSGDFSPAKVKYASIDPVGEAWSYGQLTFQNNKIYLRTQQYLYVLEMNK